jgi:hypothetical protein
MLAATDSGAADSAAYDGHGGRHVSEDSKHVEHAEYPSEDSTVIGERLANLGAWEFYRFAPRDSDEIVCAVALLPARSEVAYAVYRATDAEPSASGSIARDGDGDDVAWGDPARAAVLREILLAYRPELPALAAGLEMNLGTEDA